MDNRIDANTYYNLLKTNKINSVIELMVHPYTKSKKATRNIPKAK